MKDITVILDFPHWMNKKMVADYTCFSTKQIKRLTSSGKLPYSRIRNGHLRIDKKDFDALLMRNKIGYKKVVARILDEIK